MDSSSDSYLHKKFKKQLSTTIDNGRNGGGGGGGKTSPKAKETQNDTKRESSGEKCASVSSSSSSNSSKNVASNVPITQSTNNFANETTLSSSSSSSTQVVYDFVKSSISSASPAENRIPWNGERVFHRSRAVSPPYKDNDCISYVISNPDSSRLVEATKYPGNTNSSSSNNNNNRGDPASFDNIKFNNAYDLTTAATTSSILDNSSYLNHHHHHNHHHQYHYLGGRDVVRGEEISQDLESIQDLNHKGEILEKMTDGGGQDKNSAGGKYVCTYCNLVCSKPSVLQKHIRAHTNERPFPCISCGFSFKTRSNLYKHCRSRTHANRVMGNKSQDMTQIDVDIEKLDGQQNDVSMEEMRLGSDTRGNQDVKQKPYKPRFKGVLDPSITENVELTKTETPVPKATNTDLLSLRIDELIHKNNSIVLVGSNDQYMFKKRSVDSNYESNHHGPEYRYKEAAYSPNNIIIDHRNEDEPLNLTYKNRKRSMSEVTEPTVQKSLIKELLLKNLYADSNKQCPHCKMIFQTVTELDLHKLRSCKGYSKTGARYSRSSSVNVASILTQNKNAFDTNPHIPAAVFPLKSPGPFLGKTRLVESDKSKSFSFDDSIQATSLQSSFANTHDLIKMRYSLSPLTISNDRSKKPPVKMFGGEVKITHASGETKSFKIDGKDERNYGTEYGGGNLSENRVVKSTLQSGGTVLHNKSGNYSKPDMKRTSSPEVIRVYDSTNASHGIDVIKPKFTFSRPEVIVDQVKNVDTSSALPAETVSGPYKYTNIMDYSQNAIKQFAPKLKQPNLSIPGIPAPAKLMVPPQRAPLFIDTKPERPPASWQKIDPSANISPMPVFPKDLDTDRRNSENIDFAQKQILLQQKMTCEPPKLQVPYNPMNVLVNGKIIRYVPGIPGPISADPPLEMAYSSNIAAISPRSSSTSNHLPKPSIKISHLEPTRIVESFPSPKGFPSSERAPSIEAPSRSPKFQSLLAIKTDTNSAKPTEMRSPKTTGEIRSPKPSESKSPVIKSPNLPATSADAPKKFVRPNSLAIKPMMSVGSKQHHGLTPTIFNQILISPDTPRVAKKYNHQILHGNYFSYLGLKSSTKPTYCTLNKTQPFYVPHFKTLSMYSEWTQRDTKTDKLFVSAYDSRQKQQKYTTAGMAKADLMIHSSYKFTVTEATTNADEPPKNILGGYESNDDYTYVRGRGRGRYVCDQCGIRCKKPSMLKKHIRTHSNDRPYTCSHCNFSFKTKGNLTKHMKSKAHTKNYAAYSSSSSNSSAQQSGTPSSESDTDDSGMDSSDESSTRHQEREAVFGLLSLSQKPAVTENHRNSSLNNHSPNGTSPSLSVDPVSSFMDTEQIAHMTKTNYAKNKILDQAVNFSAARLSEISFSSTSEIQEKQKLSQFLGKSNMVNRPLTYPYTNASPSEALPMQASSNEDIPERSKTPDSFMGMGEKPADPKHFSVVKKYAKYHKSIEEKTHIEENLRKSDEFEPPPPSVQLIDAPQNVASDLRKRKGSPDHALASTKIQKNDSEVMDLSIPERKPHVPEGLPNGFVHNPDHHQHQEMIIDNHTAVPKDPQNLTQIDEDRMNDGSAIYNHYGDNLDVAYENERNRAKSAESPMDIAETNDVRIVYRMKDQQQDQTGLKPIDYDNSAMETLADIATKQEKLEKNSVAKNVASELLKLAIKNECQNSEGLKDANFISSNKDVNELIGKPEENKSCTICSKSFCKPSQLKLHMNIHYLERPYRCDSCSVSFRTKGHLQKHERSASHHNKLSSSPNLSSSEPRPFKCTDCNIAFRIHGHLAKHLRAKMHIMKLECLNKIPFGLYAELERSNSLLTEINTTDGDQCLESLKLLAKKVFTNDPGKLNQLGPSPTESIDMDS